MICVIFLLLAVIHTWISLCKKHWPIQQIVCIGDYYYIDSNIVTIDFTLKKTLFRLCLHELLIEYFHSRNRAVRLWCQTVCNWRTCQSCKTPQNLNVGYYNVIKTHTFLYTATKIGMFHIFIPLFYTPSMTSFRLRYSGTAVNMVLFRLLSETSHYVNIAVYVNIVSDYLSGLQNDFFKSV